MVSLDAKTLSEMKANARRICAAVNACEGITTEALEFAAAENIRLDFAGRSARITELETSVPTINARLLEALKMVCQNMGWDDDTLDHIDYVRTARAAIAAAEGYEPVAIILPGWEDLSLKTSARQPYAAQQHESIIPAPPYNQYQTLQLCERWFFRNQPLAVLPGTKVEAVKTIRDALNMNPEKFVQPQFQRLIAAAQEIAEYYTLDDLLPSRDLIRELKNALRDPHGWEPRGIVAPVDEAAANLPAQVIANLTRKLGDTIKALKFVRSVMISNGIHETSERLALEKIDEALKPYEPDGPDPTDLARDYNDAVQDAEQPTPYDP